MDKVSQKFLRAVRDFNLIPPGSKVLVALSGGVDSVVLLHLLREFKEFLNLKGLAAVHVNHGIRKTAKRDEDFCKKLCSNWNIPLEVGHFDVPLIAKEKKQSVEEAAREVRYKFLEEVRERLGFDLIATAHHLDDLIETQLLFYARGGVGGLKGFPPKAGVVIRPLFYLTKEEIRDYAASRGLQWVEDETNADLSIARNRIRHRVVPELRRINPSLEDSALRIFKTLWAEQEFWEKHVDGLMEKLVSSEGLDLKGFSTLTVAEQRRLLKRLFPLYTFETLEEIRQFLTNPHRKEFKVGDKLLVKVENRLITTEESFVKPYAYRLPIPGEVFIPEANALMRTKVRKLSSREELFKKPPNVEYFQFETLPEFFIVRNRRKGDRFVPFGKHKAVKLKEILIKEGVPRFMRDRLPLLTLANQILWIAGLRRGNFYPVKDLNKEVVEVVYEQQRLD